jgi:DHA1 family bicyclomycin/chloramphenicol resistance-like MFS transporter
MKTRTLIVLLAALSMIGAFSIDTYLPALPAIAREFAISSIAVQQSLSIFLIGSATMTLFYGTLSDSFGRRLVIIVSLIIYVAGSIGCALAPSLAWLLLFRLLQGLCAGAGNVVGRAMVGDLFTGAEAQRTMSFISMLFCLAPAIAPVLGGWLQSVLGWRSIFCFVAAFGLLLLVSCLRLLPETLEPARRHPFHPKVILLHYWQVGGHVRFILMCLGNALTFCGVSIYIGSAPAFVYSILHLTPREFAWLFFPLIGGMIVGAMLAARLSHQLSRKAFVRIGYTLMFVSAVWNVAYNCLFVAQIPWAVLPLFFYCVGLTLSAPAMSMRLLEMFPKTRGLASSLMSFIFMSLFAFVAGVICPRLSSSALHLALGIFVGLVLSIVCWWLGTLTDPDAVPLEPIATPEEIPIEL